jgi:predicted lipase
MTLEIQVLVLDTNKSGAGKNLLMESKPSPLNNLNKWISNIYKQTINYQHRIAATQKDHILYCTTRMKDKINVDSTMAISVKYMITL